MAGSNSKHFKALIKKNWIIWKRNRCCSFMEILLPLIFNLFVIIARLKDKTTDFPETSYYATAN